jgi:hypothetical protein
LATLNYQLVGKRTSTDYATTDYREERRNSYQWQVYAGHNKMLYFKSPYFSIQCNLLCNKNNLIALYLSFPLQNKPYSFEAITECLLLFFNAIVTGLPIFLGGGGDTEHCLILLDILVKAYPQMLFFQPCEFFFNSIHCGSRHFFPH